MNKEPPKTVGEGMEQEAKDLMAFFVDQFIQDSHLGKKVNKRIRKMFQENGDMELQMVGFLARIGMNLVCLRMCETDLPSKLAMSATTEDVERFEDENPRNGPIQEA